MSASPSSVNGQPSSARPDPDRELLDDDDDMDYEPTTTEADEDDVDESQHANERDHEDAEENLEDLDIQFTLEGGDLAEDDEENDAEEEHDDESIRPIGPGLFATQSDILMMLRREAGIGGLLGEHFSLRRRANDGNDDEDDDDDDGDDDDDDDYDYDGDDDAGYLGLSMPRRRRAKARKPPDIPKPPSEAGIELMSSGKFGTPDPRVNTKLHKPSRVADSLMRRELGVEGVGLGARANRLISQHLIPSSRADTIIHHDSRCYSGQFSLDGNFFFSCAQDFRVRMYDTSNPYEWKYYKTVIHPFGQWTITDASLSPDNKYLAYSSIRSIVCLAPTDPNENSEPWLLDFAGFEGVRRRGLGPYGHFGIWSVRFSGDGRELVAGTQEHCVCVYDIETRQTILKIHGHDNDVNAVCYGDDTSPHILYSGSDDSTLKVWDRRSLGDSREAGVFLGHTEGLTYVDSKGDGRYVLSNGKDQTMKLWDLRKMMSTDRFDKIEPADYTSNAFDYRYMPYDEADHDPHPHDCSLVTFRGHRVLKTLIRCHFSPPGSTDARYVYSGSEDGSVYVYNLDASLAGKINVGEATDRSRPEHSSRFGGDDFNDWGTGGGRSEWKTCVRDASWHPNAPILAATSWNGWGMSTGTCSVHSWNDGAEDDEGEPRMGNCVDETLEHAEDFYVDPSPQPTNHGPRRRRTRLRNIRSRQADE